MRNHGVFWKLEALSDRQLLERLGSVLGSSRWLMAELIAHLGEVEERRLHLAAACSSMFAYCLKLGMTEDEAYRRIEVARLARRYPAIFPLIANGKLSLSVVALLKHHLSEGNHLELLAAVTGKSVAQTRELMAARFPRPDVPSSVRKLPERRAMTQPALAPSTPTASASGTGPSSGVTGPSSCRTEPSFNVTSSTEVPPCAVSADVARRGSSMSFAPAVNATRATAPETPAPTNATRATAPETPAPTDAQRVAPLPPPDAQRVAPPPPSSRIEPLSAQRYKVQFTASGELARKLELARELMRHCHPGGELGPIVERALDLLIESLMQRRFGRKARPKGTSACARSTGPEPRSDVTSDRSTMRATAEPTTFAHAPAHHATRATAEPTMTARPEPATSESAPPGVVPPELPPPESARPEPATSESAPPESVDVPVDRRGELTRVSVSSYIPRSTRRVVVEREGLGRSWVDEHGVRCGSRAWLEYDHRHPRAKGGNSEPDNVRLLCRSHNRFAAERAYGRKHVERTIAERQRDERNGTSANGRSVARDSQAFADDGSGL